MLLTVLIAACPLLAAAALNNDPSGVRPPDRMYNPSQQRMLNQMQMQQQQQQMQLRNDQQMESQALQQKIQQQQNRAQQRITHAQP